jgi:hypothetical protein
MNQIEICVTEVPPRLEKAEGTYSERDNGRTGATGPTETYEGVQHVVSARSSISGP